MVEVKMPVMAMGAQLVVSFETEEEAARAARATHAFIKAYVAEVKANPEPFVG